MKASNLIYFNHQIRMKRLVSVSFFLIALTFSAFQLKAQNRILNPNRTLCLPANVQIAFLNYCSNCSYKFGPAGGTLTTVNPTTNPGGTGYFSRTNLSAGTYTLTENNVNIGTLVLTASTPGTLTLSTDTSPPWGCSGTQITLTAGGANGYSWTKNGGTPFSTASQITVTLAQGTTDTYEVRGTFNNCGSTTYQTQSIPVIGHALVSGVSITGGVPSRCQGGGTTSFNFSASNWISLSDWSINQGGTINSSGVVSWNTGFSGVATISRTAYGNCGSSITATKSVTVNPSPVKQYVSASKTALCPTETSTIGVTGTVNGTTYRLYRVGNSNAISTKGGLSSGGSITFGNYSAAGQYYVTGQNSCGTIEMHNRITLTNKPGNTASIAITRSGNFSTESGNSNQLYACSGTTITLGINATGINLSSWQWRRNGAAYGNANANSITLNQSGTYTLDIGSFSYDTQNCYSGTINDPSVSITIHAPVGNLSNKTANFTSCQSGRDPGVMAPSGQIVKWYTSGGSPISGTPNFDALAVGTHTYKVKASNNHPTRECISSGFATVTINVTEPTPTIHGTNQYCAASVPSSDRLYVRDADTHCSWQLRASNGSTVLDNSLSWDGTAGMHYFDFTPRSTPGTLTVRAYREGAQFASFTQTVVSDKTASAAITYGGDFGYDAGNNKLHACGNATITLSKNTVGLNVSQWYWKKNGVKINGTDNDNTYTPTSDGIYELHLQTWSYDVTNCYGGSISNPSVEVNKINVSNLESVTRTFNECQGSRTVTVDQLSNGNAIPGSYAIQWYNSAGSALSSEPNWNDLGVGTHTYKVKGKVSNSFRTCYSPSFGTITVTIEDLSVNIISPSNNATVATGSTLSINTTEINPYGTIAYFLEGAGTSTPVPNPSSFTVSSNATWGNDYRIKATTCSGNFYSPTFNIADYNRNTLILPLAGTSSYTEPVEIKWVRRPGDSYKFIYESVVTGTRVETSLSAGSLTSDEVTFSYSWPVPDDLEGEYTLKIEESSGSYSYSGDISFYSDLELLTPNKNLSYEVGRPLYVEWRGGDLHDGTSYVINLLKGGVYQSTLGSVVGEQTFTWHVPETFTLASDYQIQIRQTLSLGVKMDNSDQQFSLISCENPVSPTASQDQNYVKSYLAREPDGGCLSRLNDKSKVMESISYMDGLGRPLQTVIRNSTPATSGVSYDLVTMVEYDQYGRQSKEHLPFASGFNDGRYLDMSVAANTTQKQNFHESLYPGEGSFAFEESDIEVSPLARVLEQGAMGQAWQLGGGHTQEMEYLTNAANEVMSFDIVGNTISTTYYLADDLIKSVTYDENTGEQEGEVIEYTDKLGRIILKRTKLSETSGVKTYAQTYYLYDDLGNLRFVLQPEGVRLMEDTNEPAITWASLNDEGFRKNWMFSYEYDGRRRMIRKRIPGSEWVEMVYDDRDRLVLRRDGNQDLSDLNLGVQELSGNEGYSSPSYEAHGTGKIVLSVGFSFIASGTNTFRAKASPIPEDRGWIYTKYDHLNRPIMTGLLNDHRSRDELAAAVQTFYNATGSYYEVEELTSSTGYSNQSFPTVNKGGIVDLEDALTVTYYDDYSFTSETLPPGALSNVRGQITGSKVRVLGTDSWLNTVTFYDSRYRIIEIKSDNYIGGEDIATTAYRNAISMLPANVISQHTGVEAVTIQESYTYDHMDRSLTTSHGINGTSPTIISSLSYNGMNEMIEKNLGGVSSPVQSLDYSYNIRGWLSEMNGGDTYDDSNDKFGLRLGYDNASNGFQQYNGNIGKMLWRSQGGGLQSTAQEYTYRYDPSSRLTSAIYAGTGSFNVDTVQYDHNGNIQTLQRGTKDNLTYNYGSGSNRGNRLLSVSDSGLSELFQDGNTLGEDYSYDDNGNMEKDLNKHIASIEYNYLNLPELVTFENGNTVSYTYNAEGIKLRKVANIGSSVTTTDYVEGLHFVNNSLSFIQQTEGRAIKDGGTFVYEYFLTDHLGNVRVTVNESGQVAQRDGYYPFGLTFNSSVSSPENLYKYNGKEEQKESDWYDYGARMYDPTLGRFFTQDRFSEKYYNLAPYQYAANNPILFVDINGDSIDVSGVNGRDRRALKKDLASKTGLKLKVKKGFLVYKIDSNGNEKSNNSIDVSETARGDLMDAIDHKETVSVKSGDRGSLTVDGTNQIELDRSEILAGINQTTGGLDKTTMGYALIFMHELYHTEVGGDLKDPVRNLRAVRTGATVDRVNTIREELGFFYGQRTNYGRSKVLNFNIGSVDMNNPIVKPKKNLYNRIRSKLGLLKLKRKY